MSESVASLRHLVAEAEAAAETVFHALRPGPTDEDYRRWRQAWNVLDGLHGIGMRVRQMEET